MCIIKKTKGDKKNVYDESVQTKTNEWMNGTETLYRNVEIESIEMLKRWETFRMSEWNEMLERRYACPFPSIGLITLLNRLNIN